MAGYDAAHTGWNRAETALYPPFLVKVDYTLGPSIHGLATYGDTLFVTCRSDTNFLRAMRISTGEILWEFPIPGSGGAADNTPAVWDTLVYVGGQQGDGLYCLDTRTGSVVWSHPTGSLYMHHTTVDAGKVYVNVSNDSLYCFDGLIGSTLWSQPSGNSPVPAIVGDTLFVSTRSDSLFALDKDSGNRFWAVEVPVRRCLFVAGDSLLYFRSGYSTVKALRRGDGSEKWSREFPGESVADLDLGALAYAHHMLFVSIWTDTTGNGKIVALDGDTGNTIWDFIFGVEGVYAPVIANGVVYEGSWGGWDLLKLYAFNAFTGDSLATFADMGAHYIVSDGSLITRGVSEDIHILRNDPLGIESENPIKNRPPRGINLGQNFPNPFNPSTEIRYDVHDDRTWVGLSIYNVRGRRIRTLVDRTVEAGPHIVHWDGKDESGHTVPSGIYLYRLTAYDGENSAAAPVNRKMILLK